MIDLNAIRNALATQINTQTGVRALGQVKDQVSPPVALVLPGIPPVLYGQTMDEAVTINLSVLLLLSTAPPTEKVQRALDSYLGVGPPVGQSIASAVLADETLGGLVEWAVPVAVTSYGQVEYAAETYFGARINIQIGAHH